MRQRAFVAAGTANKRRLGEESAERKIRRRLFLCRGYPSRAQGKKPRPTRQPRGRCGEQQAQPRRAGPGAKSKEPAGRRRYENRSFADGCGVDMFEAGAAGGGAASSATTIWLACWLRGGATWEHLCRTFGLRCGCC